MRPRRLTFFSYFTDTEIRRLDDAYDNEQYDTLERLCDDLDVNYTLLICEGVARRRASVNVSEAYAKKNGSQPL